MTPTTSLPLFLTPGQDSYSAYTVACYIVLFSVIATHLKDSSQLCRLLGAISIMGTLVGGYAILQHYEFDFLNLMEPLVSNRASSAMGGAIFAASVLTMTLPASLLAATMAITGRLNTPKTWGRISFFALLIAVQLLGIIFMFSRGPWVGMGLALFALLFFTTVFVGWRYAANSALVLAMATIVTAVVLVSPILEEGETTTEKGSSVAALEERVISIPAQVTSGSLSGRRAIWYNSWDLIVDRPWADFDDLGLEFLRPLIGYGPDLYRYTYLLVSPESPGGRPPNEVAHGHNILVHQAVELGFLGVIATLANFVVPLLLAAYWLLRRRHDLNSMQKLALAGLAAILAGRFLEQMVGVARVSDLALAWTLLAIFAALSTIDWGSSSNDSARRPVIRPIPSRMARGVTPISPQTWFSSPRVLSGIIFVALVAAAVGGLIWFKNVNYVRAAFAADQGAERFRSGDLTGALDSLDHAIELAPDVSTYHQERSRVYATDIRDISASSTDRSASIATDLERLVGEKYAGNAQWVRERPLDIRARLFKAESASELASLRLESALNQEAAQLFEETIQLLPAFLTLRNMLAVVYINLGQAQAALPHLAVARTAGEPHGEIVTTLLIEGMAHRQLGDFDKSIRSIDEAIARSPMNADAYYERGASNYDAGDLTVAVADLDESVRLHPDQARTHHLRGTAYYNLSRYEVAILDLGQAISLKPGLERAYNTRGLAYARVGRLESALEDFDSAIGLDGSLADSYNNRGFVLRDLGRLEEALRDLTLAVNLDPEFQLAYYNRALANTMLGREAEAEADARRAVDLGFDADLLSRAINELRR